MSQPTSCGQFCEVLYWEGAGLAPGQQWSVLPVVRKDLGAVDPARTTVHEQTRSLLLPARAPWTFTEAASVVTWSTVP